MLKTAMKTFRHKSPDKRYMKGYPALGTRWHVSTAKIQISLRNEGYAHIRQNLRCLHTQSISVDEDFDQTFGTLSRWIKCTSA